MRSEARTPERRLKARFPLQRDVRYKVLEDDRIVAAGEGMSLNVSSSGLAMAIDQQLSPGAFVEVSISWPVLLDANCPMRLNVFGRVVRSEAAKTACTIDKYEFRTQSRKLQLPTPIRGDSRLQRWADGYRKEVMKAGA
jgi:hypothetical protein